MHTKIGYIGKRKRKRSYVFETTYFALRQRVNFDSGYFLLGPPRMKHSSKPKNISIIALASPFIIVNMEVLRRSPKIPFKVYEPLLKNQDEVGESKNLKRDEPTEKTGEQVKELTARIELLERLCSQIEGERNNLREQNERLTRLLPINAGSAQAQERKEERSLWQRLFG